MDDENKTLLFMNKNVSSILLSMKKDRMNHTYNKYSSSNNAYKLLEKIIEDFSVSFHEKKMESFNYLFLYYSFQVFLFSDPDNYFLHNEDNIQELLFRTYFSFRRFMESHYSPENLANLDSTIPFDTFILRNFTRVMALEFRNIKRISERESKKPCSTVSFNSDDYDEFMSSLDYGYEINDELPFLTIPDIRKAYG